MKALIATLILTGYAFTAQAAQVEVKTCDASVVVGIDDQQVKTLGFRPQFGLVADNGKSFTVVQENNVMASPPLKQVKPGIWRAVSNDGFVFIKRDGSYQISQDATTWLMYNNCQNSGVEM